MGDPMMMLSMLEGGEMSEMLPLMMMNGGAQGQACAMNPMMMMSLLGDDSKSKDACNKKFKMTAFEAAESEGKFTLSEVADVQAFFEASGLENDYTKCLSEAT